MASIAERQKAIRSQLVSDEDMAKGVSVGTFRWKRGKKMVTMPTFHAGTRFPPLLRGWQTYLTNRCGPDKAVQSAFIQNRLDTITNPSSNHIDSELYLWISSLEMSE